MTKKQAPEEPQLGDRKRQGCGAGTDVKLRPVHDIWQARVNKDWQFYFKIVEDAQVIRDVGPHPK